MLLASGSCRIVFGCNFKPAVLVCVLTGVGSCPYDDVVLALCVVLLLRIANVLSILSPVPTLRCGFRFTRSTATYPALEVTFCGGSVPVALSFDILSLSLPFLWSCWRSTLRHVVETRSRIRGGRAVLLTRVQFARNRTLWFEEEQTQQP